MSSGCWAPGPVSFQFVKLSTTAQATGATTKTRTSRRDGARNAATRSPSPRLRGRRAIIDGGASRADGLDRRAQEPPHEVLRLLLHGIGAQEISCLLGEV